MLPQQRMLCFIILVALPLLAGGFLYQPGTGGQIWDPSVTYWRGKWYAHAMYQRPGDRTNSYAAGWLAESTDGVHWTDGGEICPEIPGDMWWKGFVRQVRGRADNWTDEALFVMDHGVDEAGKGNDALRFLTSTDLKNWAVNSTSHPDPRWYRTGGRWDHMYMSRDPAGGFIGMAVSSPTTPGFAGTWPAVQRSPDGIDWTVGPPLNVSWSGVSPTAIEEGGFERIGNKFYLIGGGGSFRMAYSMWVFEADRIDGPYQPLAEGFRLSGGSAGRYCGHFGWLAAFCGPECGPGEGPLVSNYITPGRNARADVWLLPMRRPVLQAGRLRLGYWPANDALQAAPHPASPGQLSCSGPAGALWLSSFSAAEHQQGGVLLLNVSAAGPGRVGVAIEDLGGPGYTVLTLTIGPDGAADSTAQLHRVVNASQPELLDSAGWFRCGGQNCGVASLTGLAAGDVHRLRVLFRAGMWELYADELLVQSFVYGQGYPLPAQGAGRVGLACMGSVKATVSQVAAWRMAL